MGRGGRAVSRMPATRLYYIHPLLAGPVDTWSRQLDRVATMRFDTVAIAPPFATGQLADLFLTADHDRLDSRLGGSDALSALARFAEECKRRQLRPMLDVVVDRVAVEHVTNGLADWYRADSLDELPDPRRPAQQRGVARLLAEEDLAGAIGWWERQLGEWVDAAIADFRCIRPHQVPGQFWRELINAVRRSHPHASFMASTLAIEPTETGALTECGFGLVASCLRNWDYRGEDFPEAVNRLAHVAPVIAMPEAPFDR